MDGERGVKEWKGMEGKGLKPPKMIL